MRRESCRGFIRFTKWLYFQNSLPAEEYFSIESCNVSCSTGAPSHALESGRTVLLVSGTHASRVSSCTGQSKRTLPEEATVSHPRPDSIFQVHPSSRFLTRMGRWQKSHRLADAIPPKSTPCGWNGDPNVINNGPNSSPNFIYFYVVRLLRTPNGPLKLTIPGKFVDSTLGSNFNFADFGIIGDDQTNIAACSTPESNSNSVTDPASLTFCAAQFFDGTDSSVTGNQAVLVMNSGLQSQRHDRDSYRFLCSAGLLRSIDRLSH